MSNSVSVKEEKRPIIEKLSADVINRIAAGEVVQRPAAALKEMLENSIDAGARNVTVTVRDGGISLLQVTDDGCGISKRDLPLLCARFATSKLRKFEDLMNMQTFGFRGEALASISMVAHVSCVTKTPDTSFAFCALYEHGNLTASPSPQAGLNGTTITVEDMFFNVPLRKRTMLAHVSAEFAQIAEVVVHYSFEFPHIGFTLKRLVVGSRSSAAVNGVQSRTERQFSAGSTTLQNIGQIYGSSFSKHLKPIAFGKPKPQERKRKREPNTHDEDKAIEESAEESDADVSQENVNENNFDFSFSGYCSSLSLSIKRQNTVLFINKRRVENFAIKRAIDQAYAPYLVDGNKPFVFLDVSVLPNRLDVNVHPTKNEVLLLDEEDICMHLFTALSAAIREDLKEKSLTSVDADKRKKRSDDDPASTLPLFAARLVEDRGALVNLLESATKKADTPESTSPDEPLERNSFPLQNASLPLGERELGDEASVAEEKQSSNRNTPVSGRIMLEKMLALPQDSSGDEDESSYDDVGREFRQHMKDSKLEKESKDARGRECSRPSSSTLGADSDASSQHGDAEAKNAVLEKAEGDLTNENKTKFNSEVPVNGSLESEKQIQKPPPQLLDSVRQIICSIVNASSLEVLSLFEKVVYVGVVNSLYIMLQSGTTLLLVDWRNLLWRICWQRVFLRWGQQEICTFSKETAPLLLDLLTYAEHATPPALDWNTPNPPIDLPVFAAVREVMSVSAMYERLCTWREMLAEYFGVIFTNEEPKTSADEEEEKVHEEEKTKEEGGVVSDLQLFGFPLLAGRGWPINQGAIPFCVRRLATDVDYECGDENIVFGQIAGVLAWCASCDVPIKGINSGESAKEVALGKFVASSFVKLVSNRQCFIPPLDTVRDGTVRTVVTVEKLFKVFERC